MSGRTFNFSMSPPRLRQGLIPVGMATRGRRYLLGAGWALLLMTCGQVHAQSLGGCGNLENAFGPFDYRTERDIHLKLVESAHFTPSVETLIRGKSSPIGGDLDYTLRAFPNHHRALISMMRYGERLKVSRVPSAQFDVECYFVRAVSFQPDDVVARMLYAQFLLNSKRRDDALQQLAAAQPYARDNPFTHYNLGLSFLAAEQYDQALKHAHQAMALGFPRPELKAQLQAKGQWQEPVSVDSAASAAVSAQGMAAPASAAAQ